MEFFNNKENDVLKFKINAEGVTNALIDARLIFLTSENKNYLIAGKIDEDICEFPVPVLELYEKNNTGKIVFEIVSGDTYFRVWEDTFTINSKMSIVVENVVEEKKEIKKEPVQVSLISETKAIKEPKIETKKPIKEKKKSTKKPTSGFPTFGDVD